MGLYKFLFVGLRFLHLIVGVFFGVVLAGLAVAGKITTLAQLGHEIRVAVIAYSFFLLGIAAAIGGRLHRYVSDEPANKREV